MQIVPYLNFDGNCAEAFRFYERVLGGRIEAILTHGDSPVAAQVPPGWAARVMHARLMVGDQVLLASDAPPDQYVTPRWMYVLLGWRRRRKRSGCSRSCPREGRSPCRSSPPSGLFASACARTGSGSGGW